MIQLTCMYILIHVHMIKIYVRKTCIQVISFKMLTFSWISARYTNMSHVTQTGIYFKQTCIQVKHAYLLYTCVCVPVKHDAYVV